MPKAVSIDTLKNNKVERMAWWYCGIYKNHNAKSQPKVLVAFKEIVGGILTGEESRELIPLTALGQVTIGSIWKEGVCKSEAQFAVKDFELNFCTDGWRFTSFNDTSKNGTEPPYPLTIHPLLYEADKNWFIEFKLPSGGKLVVPCLEFFSRCYGRSQELNRILATYPWAGPDSCETRFYAPIDEPEDPDNKWQVKLRMRLRNGDTTFLAHAKYDSYTKEKAKLIYSQLENYFNTKSKAPMFIQAAPWFQGPAEIRARGLSFDNNRSFLALQIIGCSDPDGILIIRDRENTNKLEVENTSGNDDAPFAPPTKTLIRPPDICDLTGDTEPDHGTNGIEILDQDFVVLGIPRAIVDRYGKKITDRSRIRLTGDDASKYSSGEPQGSGKGVGSASIYAKQIMDSHGTLIDMWNAILHIQKKNPDMIQNVEWFTFEDGYKSTGTPNLIGLEPFDEGDSQQIPTETRNWVYHDVSIPRVRGVMVARMTINGALVHIIEIQRRPRVIKDKKSGREKDSEESFMGFVITIEEHDQFVCWLKRFLSDLRYIRGIVKKLTPYAPGKVGAFTHKPARHEEIPCEAAVINALSKVNVLL